MGWPGVGAVSYHVVMALQGLFVWKQCFQTRYETDFWRWKCFQNGVYVKTVDSRITVFTMYVFCCFFCYGVSFVFCCVA